MVKDWIEIIIVTLQPVLGEHMARAVVTGTTAKMGITGDPSPADLERLVQSLGLGLNVFVGRVKSKMLTQEIYKRLGLPGK
jgi:hypothetical protein